VPAQTHRSLALRTHATLDSERCVFHAVIAATAAGLAQTLPSRDVSSPSRHPPALLSGRMVQIRFTKPFSGAMRSFCGHPYRPDPGAPVSRAITRPPSLSARTKSEPGSTPRARARRMISTWLSLDRLPASIARTPTSETPRTAAASSLRPRCSRLADCASEFRQLRRSRTEPRRTRRPRRKDRCENRS
jgi:hypothetical protein